MWFFYSVERHYAEPMVGRRHHSLLIINLTEQVNLNHIGAIYKNVGWCVTLKHSCSFSTPHVSWLSVIIYFYIIIDIDRGRNNSVKKN